MRFFDIRYRNPGLRFGLVPLLLLLIQVAAAQRPPGDTIVALKAKGKLVGDFTLDTLVRFLNANNGNPHYRYVRFTEDDTRTGYYADYVLNLKVIVSPSRIRPPAGEPISSSGMDAATPSLYWNDGPLYRVPAGATCTISILEKWNHERKSWFRFTTLAPSDESLPVRFVSDLLHQLLRVRFPGGTGDPGRAGIPPPAEQVVGAPARKEYLTTVALRLTARVGAGYSVDTLVKYLSSLNENPRVRYLPLNANEMRTGLYSPIVFDIIIGMPTDSTQVATGLARAQCTIVEQPNPSNHQGHRSAFVARADSEPELRNKILIELLYEFLQKRFGAGKTK